MTKLVEIELRFQVPAQARAAVAAEMARRATTLEHRKLAAIYLDTPDRALARAGIAWRLRREGRRWIQTLKQGSAGALHRFEHEVLRPGPTHDAAAHAGTSVGDQLVSILDQARAAGSDVEARFLTDVRRTARRIRTKGATVEMVLDEGKLIAGGATQRIREMEFELVSGSAAAMIALADRWRRRFGLILEPRSKAERGDRLADGFQFPAVRKAARPDFARTAGAVDAMGATVDECLAQITYNAIGIAQGDPESRVEHVHQLRVGIRRLRSALRCFDDWAPQPPAELVDALRALFATLGASRDGSVLESGVMKELAQVGAPAIAVGPADATADPVAAVRADDTQRLLLAWVAWRTESLAEATVAHVPPSDAPEPCPAALDTGGPDDGDAPRATVIDAKALRRAAHRRLLRWHRRIIQDARQFDELDEAALHTLRKRIKRQRYAVEFFAPMLRRQTIDRYVKPLARIQERMGELNDLFVARATFQAMVETHPAAWFALGWLAARILDVRGMAKPVLVQFARTKPPQAL